MLYGLQVAQGISQHPEGLVRVPLIVEDLGQVPKPEADRSAQSNRPDDAQTSLEEPHG